MICGGSEDAGYSSAWHHNNNTSNNWLYSGGSYTPSSQEGSRSARFHSYGITSGVSSYIESPVIDLSAYSIVDLSFYMINSDGTDKLEVFFYNGSSWTEISEYFVQSSWGQKTLSIPANYHVSTFKVRFLATSDYGLSDIGLDAMYITGGTASSTAWEGSVSSAWTTAGNWSGGVVPDQYTSVTIPSGVPNYPVISASEVAVCNDLTIDPSALITIGNTIASSGSFTIHGDLVNNGNIYHTSDANTNLSGANNTISGTGNFAYNNEYVSFTLTDGAVYTLASNIDLINQLRVVTNSTFNLSTYELSLATLSFDAGTINLNSGTLKIGESIDYTSGTWNEGTSLVHFNSGASVWTGFGYSPADQTINSFDYYNLKVRANNGYTATIGNNDTIHVANDLTLENPGTSGGTISTAYNVSVGNDVFLGVTGNAFNLILPNRITSSPGTGSLTMGNDPGHLIEATYSSSSNYVIEGFGTPTFYGTFKYNGSSSQKVIPATYGNVISDASGTKTMYGAINIDGDFTLNGGSWDQLSYDIYVAGDWTSNGDYFLEGDGTVTFDGSSSSTVTATTNQIVTVLVTESFENGGSLPSGWTTETVADPGTDPVVYFVTSSLHPSGLSATDGSYFARFNSYTSSNGAQTRLKQTTGFSTTGLSNISVSFDWSVDASYSSSNDYITVQYSTDGSNWTSVGSPIYRYSVSGTSWTNQSVDLPVGAENQSAVYLGFLFTSAYGNDCHLDNVSVSSDAELYPGEALKAVVLNKSGGATLTLGSDVLIQSSMTFVNGIINSSSASPLEFDHDATVSGATNVSHVNGPVKKRTSSTATFTFPVGDGSSYRQTWVTPSNAASTIWTAEYFPNAYSDLTTVPGLDHVSSLEYWTIDRSGTSDATIGLSWDSNSGVNSELSDLVVAHYNGVDWESAGGNNVTGSASAGTIESDSGWSSFSPFTLGSPMGSVPLPVELISFEATPQNDHVKLEWWTATEKNNDHFTVEHSVDGVNFTFVGFVDAVGNSTTVQDYTLEHRDYHSGINYYRLQQTDIDGQKSDWKIASVYMGGDNKVITGTFNTLGQRVGSNYRGIVFDIYSDGTSIQRMQ